MTHESSDQTLNPLRQYHFLFAVMFFLVPLLVFTSACGKWSLDRDEFYTMQDSSYPVGEIIESNKKPLYYLISRVSMQLPLSREFALRMPAAIAAALIPPVFYLLLRRPESPWIGSVSALLIGANPWVFELSQFARFYTLTLLFACVATLTLLRWINDRRWYWISAFFVSTILAALAHTTAFVLLPAGVIAVVFHTISANRRTQLIVGLRRYWLPFLVACVFISFVIWNNAFANFNAWSSIRHGVCGDYSVVALLTAFVVFTGPQVWALAILPLPGVWFLQKAENVFLLSMLAATIVPFLILTPFGGGIAPRYLISAVPCIFILAGKNLALLMQQLGSPFQKLALIVVVLSANLPGIMTIWTNGNHYDYRKAAKFVESLSLDNPIICATSHQMYQYYSGKGLVHELSTLANMNAEAERDTSFAGQTVRDLISIAESTGRPLILVSREDRLPFNESTRRWLSDRFVILLTIEKNGYTYRRNKIVIYEYRPSYRILPGTTADG